MALGKLTDGSAGASSSGNAKKIVIKPFKVQPKLPEGFEDATWEKLRDAVAAVFAKRPVATSREDLYRAVEDLCVHKMGARLYERLERDCQKYIRDGVFALSGRTPDHSAFLEIVSLAWSDHCDNLLTIRNIFLYLDRSFVLQTPALRSVWDMGLHHFAAAFAQAPQVQAKTIAALLALVARERGGEDVPRALLRAVLRMLSALGLYERQFQAPFLRETAEHYSSEGLRYMETSDVPNFLRHVELRLGEENDRVIHYLDAGTRKPLIAAVDSRLLRPHTAALLERGFDSLADTQRLSDLARMYSLFARVDALGELKAALAGYVRRRGLEIVMDRENDKEMVPALLAYKARIDQMAEEGMAGNDQFKLALKDTWETFVNERQNRPAELLAKFVDVKLRGEKGVSDDDVEALLERIMVIFRYLNGKDVFEAFYKKDLAKRLLLQRSASADLERSMISKLKTECGNAFTSKLEGMFKDIELSRDLMVGYTHHLNEKRSQPGFFSAAGAADVDMSVRSLTTGYWPQYPAMDVRMPAVMAEHRERFERFYTERFQGRRLAWQPILGRCSLKALFPQGRKELDVSELQAIVLMCFSKAPASAKAAAVTAGGRREASAAGAGTGAGSGSSDGAASEPARPAAPPEQPMGVQDLLEATGIEEGELKRTLQSLACGKHRVLVKEPKGREVEDGDMFLFNRDFNQRMLRIKISSIQLKETEEEVEKTHEAVFRDRQYQVDAAIVRIMKTRKTLSHTMLMSELLSQLKFPATPVDLKKRIESLIEREYLERDEGSPGVYNYLA